MMDEADAIVIGSGGLGASTAYHLSAHGRRVALLDKHAVASQTSPRAAGLSAELRHSPLMTKLAARGVEKLKGFTAETGEPLDLVRSGSMKIARTAAHAEQIAAELGLARELGIALRAVTAAEAHALNPFFEPVDVTAIAYNPDDVYLEPSQLPAGYARAAERRGCTLLPHTPVTALLAGDGRVEGVRTSRGEIRAPVVVDAAGGWLRQVAAGAGGRVPAVATRHQLLITKPIAGVRPEQPITRVIDANVYIRPCDGGLMLGGYEAAPLQVAVEDLPPDWSIDDMPLDLAVLRGLADLVLPQFPVLRELDIAVLRGGLPTMTPDDEHLIGPVPGLAGFFVVGGCNVGGLSTAPAFGELMAAMIDGAPHPYGDLSALLPARFAAPLDEGELRDRCRDHYRFHYWSTASRPVDAPPARVGSTAVGTA